MHEPDRPIRVSEGLLIAPFMDGAVVYDLARQQLHRLGFSAAWLLDYGDGATSADLVADAVAVTGRRREELEPQIVSAIGKLRQLGLLDRNSPLPESGRPLVGSARSGVGRYVGATHTVATQRIAFRSSNGPLLRQIDDFMAAGIGDLPPSLFFDVDMDDAGQIVLQTDDEWIFPNAEGFFFQLPGVLNEYAARCDAVVVLHAGAVRTPQGKVLLVAGSSNAGKSTLVAALVQAGCDYLGDESIGVRPGSLHPVGYPKPITIDPNSWAYLELGADPLAHVPVGRLRPGVELLTHADAAIHQVVFVSYRPNEPTFLRDLEAPETLQELLLHTLNLARSGEGGLATLCRLAEDVPAVLIEHGDARALAGALAVDRGPVASFLSARSAPGTSSDRSLRCPHPLDELRPTRLAGTAYQSLDLGEATAALVRGPDGVTVVLDDLASELWQRIDGKTTVGGLVDGTSSNGKELGDWRAVVLELLGLHRRGLIDLPDAAWPTRTQTQAWPRPLGPWTESPCWSLAASDPPLDSNKQSAAPQAHWDELTYRTELAGVTVATNHEDLIAALTAAADELRRLGQRPAADEATHLVELLHVPESDSMLRVGGRQVRRARPGEEIAVVAQLLASHASGGDSSSSVRVAPVQVYVDGDRAVVRVEQSPHRQHGGVDWETAAGVLVRDGKSVWIPNRQAALRWLIDGANAEAAGNVGRWYELSRLEVSAATEPLAGWVEVVDTLLPSQVTSSMLRHLAAGGQTPLSLAGGVERERRNSRSLGVTRTDDSPQETSADEEFPWTAPDDSASSSLWRWAERVGPVRVAYESARIDQGHVITGRPLLHVDLGQLVHRGDRPIDVWAALGLALVDLGFGRAVVDEVARAALDVGSFYLGEETSPRGRRRKAYVTSLNPGTWERLLLGWPRRLTEAHGSSSPEWVAWKIDLQRPERVIRAMYMTFPDNPENLFAVAQPLFDKMAEPWQEALRVLLAALGVDLSDRPIGSDLLTLQEDGRRSVDLDIRERVGASEAAQLEASVRSLVAVAGHGSDVADGLVTWLRRHHLTRLVFGLDGSGDPVVNLYAGGS